LVQSNPQIGQAIQQNPELFHQILGVDEDGQGQGQATVISVTEEEQAAIQRVSET
jgi:hypothetical protein